MMKKHLPNLITCLNAVSGTAAIFMVLHHHLLLAAALVLLAMLFDFFDGFTARLLHVKSEMGKELDSLADIVSFGVVPALLAHELIKAAIPLHDPATWTHLLPYLPVLLPAFSAYRLAKFNLDTRQTYSFIGMPTPANALFWVALLLASHYTPALYNAFWANPWLLSACLLLFSLLLVSELPMFSLKITTLAWKPNRWRYLYFSATLLLLLLFRAAAITFLIPLYLLFSLLETLTTRSTTRNKPA
jgi:CDP-diacylglycerol--serine O-phosphatidyltransferase